MKIYHVFDMSDMAQSDSFFPTKAEAMRAIRNDYECKGPGKPDGTDRFIWDSEYAAEVILEIHDIPLTRAGLCWALKNIPNR